MQAELAKPSDSRGGSFWTCLAKPGLVSGISSPPGPRRFETIREPRR